ncbi:hypothetical protein GFS24_11760 [Chitinophaga sp. SYP-B3965]|uniref:M56 family metallopeptidase n=1 Tax=Chitinophaga sp. SYP-B3965 TaxID=2663120 RepID=UPI00129A06A5|nr:M56 family metallopeptidase [Chitinophaga sp. SYP-B3965]MRG45794.1 hypothetical protein [Chitinophaga sp. SYP-B3965]
MKTFILSSIGCLLLFYSLYAIFFQRLSFHRWNRVYLIATLLISIFIPFLRFPGTGYIPAVRSTIEDVLTTQPANMPAIPDILTHSSNFNWLAGIYWMGVFIMAILFIINAIKLYKKIKNSPTVIRTKDLNASFFHYIFIQQNLDPEEERIIYLHERAHQQKLHSLDNLLLELVKIFCWFNPLVYIYGKTLKNLHELEADELVTGRVDKAAYAQLLLKFNAGKQHSLLNLYNIHPLKRRIHSLFTDKTSNMKKALYLLVLPCLALAISSFALITPNQSPKGLLIKSDSTELTIQISLKELLGANASWAAFENFEAGSFEKIRAMFKEQGYNLTVTEKVQGSNETIQLLGFELKGDLGSVSATYRVNEMISKNYYLMVSLNKEKQELKVHSSKSAFLK